MKGEAIALDVGFREGEPAQGAEKAHLACVKARVEIHAVGFDFNDGVLIPFGEDGNQGQRRMLRENVGVIAFEIIDGIEFSKDR